MGIVAPFSANKTEGQEIRQLCKIVFDGGQIVDPEIKEIEKKWGWMLELFMQMVDRRTGSFLHLPFPGSILEQPSKTMSLLECFQSMFLNKINESLKL